MTRILIVADDPVVSSLLERGFRQHGFATVLVNVGDRAAGLLASRRFDLIVVDLDVAGWDGLELLRDVRVQGEALLVIVLTGNAARYDAAVCLDLGADDYLTKPFHFDELLARVRARLRRPPIAEPPVLAVAGIHLHVAACRATAGDRVVDLTARELAVLELLMRHPGRVFSRAALLELIWGRSPEAGSGVVTVYINDLRHKLGIDAIETVRGVGYRFRDH